MGTNILLEFPNQGSKEDFESKYAEGDFLFKN